ncbi:MAG: hypothetical protein JWM82_3199, partial [Myxococcales bacterium]|nr:hypothetical protein [Myxococcales bacterium]
GGSTGAAGTTAGAAGTSGTAGGTGTAGTTGTAGAGMTGLGGMGAPVAVCDTYCTAITANCTGVNSQYPDKATCMKLCAMLPAGTSADTTGQTVGCRSNQAMAAAQDTAAIKTECWDAGPLGYGKCGSECDVFCAVALSTCGTTAYKDLADCTNTCQDIGIGRNLDFGLPGSYSSNYMAGTPGDSATDTLECRTYQLIDKALASAANVATACPNAALKSAACGPGPAPIVIPDGGGTSDGPIATYDGGVGGAITAANCNETLFPRAKRRMLLRDEGDPHLHLLDLGNPANNWSTVAGGPWARAAQLIGNNEVLGGRNDGYEVFDIKTGVIKKTVKTFGNTQSAYRMATGETMLTRSGTILTFLDKNDQMTHQISYPGYGYVRVARPTRNGTFLVPSDTTLFEGDATGKVLWTAHGKEWGHIWEPLLMKDGNTLLCTAFGSSCDVVDKTTHMVTKRYGTKQMPNAATIKPNFFAEYEILPNGNILTSNWQGHGAGNGSSGIQVLEFDPAGTVVWQYQQDPKLFSSIQGVMMLDCKDPMVLHVEETSADSTWQPVK